MSFEIRDLMVKLSSVGNPGDGDYGQQLPCDDCQTTSKLPGCPSASICTNSQCPDTVSFPGEDDKVSDAPEPGYEGAAEKEAGPRPGMAFVLLRQQLRETLGQTA